MIRESRFATIQTLHYPDSRLNFGKNVRQNLCDKNILVVEVKLLLKSYASFGNTMKFNKALYLRHVLLIFNQRKIIGEQPLAKIKVYQ